VATRGTREQLFYECCYALGTPAAIISTISIGKALNYKGYHMFSDFVSNLATLTIVNCTKVNGDVHMDLQHIRGLLYIEQLIAPMEHEHLPKQQSQNCHIGSCYQQGKHCKTCDTPWCSPAIHPLKIEFCAEHINALTRGQ
jgi:hypothetical protein